MKMMIGWMQKKIFQALMKKFIIRSIKETIYLGNPMQVAILMTFSQLYMGDSVLDSGYSENI